MGRLWDAINDPLVVALATACTVRWGGGGRSFLSVPFPLPCLLPHVRRAALREQDDPRGLLRRDLLLYDTLYTVVNVPHLSLVPELARTYDERSSLTGWRTAFSFLAQLVTAGAFKLLAEQVLPLVRRRAGRHPAGYLLAAGLWALSMVLLFIVLALSIREPDHEPVTSPIEPWRNFREVFQNRPFRLAALIYLLCFTTGDLLLLVFVRYLIDYVQVRPGLDSLVLAVVLGTSLLSIPVVLWLMRRTDKRTAWLISISFMVVVLVVGSFWAGRPKHHFCGAVLAGMGFAAMSIIPGPSWPT